MSQGYYCVDANVFITAWNYLYPISIFPTLWSKLSEKKEEIILIDPILKEIDPFSGNDGSLSPTIKKERYPLRMYMLDNGYTSVALSDDVQAKAIILEHKYEVVQNSKGANKNDILLIAYAQLNSKNIVTLEARQKTPPAKNIKI